MLPHPKIKMILVNTKLSLYMPIQNLLKDNDLAYRNWHVIFDLSLYMCYFRETILRQRMTRNLVIC